MIEKNKLLIVIPTYNEIKNIKKLISCIQNIKIDALFVDDNSPDGTSEVIKKNSQYNKNIFLISRPLKLGLGSAYRQGFAWGLKKKYTHIISMDADFSHSFEDLNKLLLNINNNELVIGSRYINGGKTTGWKTSRRILSKYANKLTKLLTSSKINDLTSGFKIYDSNLLSNISFEDTKSNGYAFQIEMINLCEAQTDSYIEIPINFRERSEGHSKMNFKIILEALMYLVLFQNKNNL